MHWITTMMGVQAEGLKNGTAFVVEVDWCVVQGYAIDRVIKLNT